MKDLEPRTTTPKLINRAALRIGLAYAVTTVHHIYGGLVDSAPNRLRVPIIMAIPSAVAAGSLHRYRDTGSRAALITAATVSGLAWVGLSGLVHGGYAHAYKDVLFLLNGPSKAVLPPKPFRALSARRSVLRDHRCARDRNGLSRGFLDVPGDPRPVQRPARAGRCGDRVWHREDAIEAGV
jgi:hypothetical protein